MNRQFCGIRRVQTMVAVEGLARVSASSWKAGHEPTLLLEGDAELYWQYACACHAKRMMGRSEGVLPHFVQFDFSRRMRLARVELELSHSKDESYTPATVIVQAGDSPNTLLDVTQATILAEDEFDAFTIDLAEANDAVRITCGGGNTLFNHAHVEIGGSLYNATFDHGELFQWQGQSHSRRQDTLCRPTPL